MAIKANAWKTLEFTFQLSFIHVAQLCLHVLSEAIIYFLNLGLVLFSHQEPVDVSRCKGPSWNSSILLPKRIALFLTDGCCCNYPLAQSQDKSPVEGVSERKLSRETARKVLLIAEKNLQRAESSHLKESGHGTRCTRGVLCVCVHGMGTAPACHRHGLSVTLQRDVLAGHGQARVAEHGSRHPEVDSNSEFSHSFPLLPSIPSGRHLTEGKAKGKTDPHRTEAKQRVKNYKKQKENLIKT